VRALPWKADKFFSWLICPERGPKVLIGFSAKENPVLHPFPGSFVNHTTRYFSPPARALLI
jgi:hypothetical protein